MQTCPICGWQWGVAYAGTRPCTEPFAGLTDDTRRANDDLKRRGCLWLNDGNRQK
jgi:hypothetical protein